MTLRQHEIKAEDCHEGGDDEEGGPASPISVHASPLPPVPEFSARQVVGADVLPGLRWMLAPAAVAGHRLASALRLLLRLLRPLHERLGAVPEVRLPPRRPGPACSGVARGRSTGAGHVRPRDAWAFNMAAYKSPLSQTSRFVENKSREPTA